MNRVTRFIAVFLVLLTIAGCETADKQQVFAATLPPENGAQLIPTSTGTPTQRPLETDTPFPTVSPQPVATATATSAPEPQREERFALIRPIRVTDTDNQRDYIDRTYPYGDTQGGTREPHSGVEFANPRGTTVIAAEAGRVIYAGQDTDMLIGPREGYYGNVVIIEHEDLRSPAGEPIYTVYAHLERILVVEQGVVTRGMPIGEVGDSGIAVGPHLHFEVRVGTDPFDFSATRNPDLYIKPYAGSGIIAGRVTDSAGNPVPGITLDIRSVRTNNLLFAFTYAHEVANSDIAWEENFTRGDLPAGQYIVMVAIDGDVKFQRRVTVEDQKIAWLDIVLE